MTATRPNGTDEEESIDDGPLFESADGLYTEQDLYSVFGTSPVTIDTDGDGVVVFEIGLGGGSVSAKIQPDQAREIGAALEDAADELDRPE